MAVHEKWFASWWQKAQKPIGVEAPLGNGSPADCRQRTARMALHKVEINPNTNFYI